MQASLFICRSCKVDRPITDGLNTDLHLDTGNGISLAKVNKFCYLGDMSVECDNFSFNVLTLLVGDKKRNWACKKVGVCLLMVAILLEICTSYSSSCHHHLHHPLLQ